MRKFWLVFGLVSLVSLSQTHMVSADVNDFVVNDFDAHYVLTADDPQGEMKVTEKIEVTFSDYNHGILRALPERYNGTNVHLKIQAVTIDGNKSAYSTYKSNGNLVLKIGDANKTITGQHTYVLAYQALNVIRFTADYDALDWNTNGTEWQQPFEHVTARLEVPSALASKMTGLQCYVGKVGSKQTDCVTSREGTMTTIAVTRQLLAGENMTFAANFPLGSFKQSTLLDGLRDNWLSLTMVILPPAGALFFAYPRWRSKGKDLKGAGTIVPEYTAPEGLRAAEADVILHYKLGKNAISATIIDLAIRKYLKIIEGESSGVLGLGKHKEYRFERLTPTTSDDLKDYEKTVLDGIFKERDTIKVADLKAQKFYTTSAAVQTAMPGNLTKAGYFTSNPSTSGQTLYIVATVLFFGGVLFHSWLSAGCILAAIILFLFARLMPKRTQLGVDTKDYLEGLKLYMNTAEKDRIAMLQSPDAPYADKASGPIKTVALFEKLLPFAMIMGVEKKWADQFKDIYNTPPDWYSGNWTAFNAGYLVGSLNGSMQAMNTAFAAPSSSGSGGAGGFSGGGGGGGGGGGW